MHHNNKSVHICNPKIKSSLAANKYANIKAEADKACADMVRIGGSNGSSQVIDTAPMEKMASEAIHKYNKENYIKRKHTYSETSSSLKSAVPSLVVTIQVTQAIGPLPKNILV